MNVELLHYTKEPFKIINTACKTCYSSNVPSDIFLQEPNLNLIDQVYNSGHLSTFEHVNFTFSIEGISRACSHQLVRQRLCSFSQQSQRYVKFDNPTFYKPHEILKNRLADSIYNEFLITCKATYNKLIELGIKAEDARMILPNATCSNIVITLNLREFIHICNLRLCTRAQSEIRQIVKQMAKEAISKEPILSKYLVCQCEKNGFCNEHNSCGKYKQIKK